MERLHILRKFIDLFKSEVALKSAETINVESTRFLIDNAHRSLNILESVYILIENNNGHLSAIEHSVGILLRSGLYDYITFSYYSNKSIEGESFDVSKFETYILNHIKGHFNRFEWNDKLKKEFGDIVEFKDNGKVKLFKELRVFPDALRCAKENKLGILEVAVNAWQWYSKYEHYGYFTPQMLKRSEANKDRIDYSIFLIMVNIVLSFKALKDFNVRVLKTEELIHNFEFLVDSYMKK